jgi:hypothetical protein
MFYWLDSFIQLSPVLLPSGHGFFCTVFNILRRFNQIGRLAGPTQSADRHAVSGLELWPVPAHRLAIYMRATD